MAKRTKAERQKSARKAARTRAKNEACKPGKKPKAAKKGAKKAAEKPKGKRSAKQKANDKRLGNMAKARAKKGGAKKPKSAKKGSKPKKPKGAKKGGAKKSPKRAASGGITNGEARLSHVEKVQLADHKVLTKHSRQLSTLGSTERKMKQILGAKGLSAKSALSPKIKVSIGKQIKLETKKAVAKVKDAAEAANAAKYG